MSTSFYFYYHYQLQHYCIHHDHYCYQYRKTSEVMVHRILCQNYYCPLINLLDYYYYISLLIRDDLSVFFLAFIAIQTFSCQSCAFRFTLIPMPDETTVKHSFMNQQPTHNWYSISNKIVVCVMSLNSHKTLLIWLYYLIFIHFEMKTLRLKYVK